MPYDRDSEDRAAIAGASRERGATLVPPYDDPLIIAGQGTAGREIMEDLAALISSPTSCWWALPAAGSLPALR